MNLFGVFSLFLISCEIFVASSSQVQPCGQRKGGGGNIIDGIKAKKNEWPWLVAFVKVPEGKFFCGGSLISDKHILSGE